MNFSAHRNGFSLTAMEMDYVATVVICISRSLPANLIQSIPTVYMTGVRLIRQAHMPHNFPFADVTIV